MGALERGREDVGARVWVVHDVEKMGVCLRIVRVDIAVVWIWKLFSQSAHQP